MAARNLPLDGKLEQYLVAHSVREHPVQRELREATAGMKDAGMQIGPDQAQFMQLLVKAIGARRTIEIGVFTGYSALAVALALPQDGRIVACDVSGEWTSMGRRYWEKAGVAGKIDLRLQPALRTLDELLAAGEEGRFDFAFIDADKGGYMDYYERCMRLVRRGGIIAIDNTLWSGRVADAAEDDGDTRAIRSLNDRLRDDARIALSLLPVGDGLSLALKL